MGWCLLLSKVVAGLLSEVALTPVLEAINSVSELLQSSTTDILTAQQQQRALGGELRRLRSDDIYMELGRIRCNDNG